MATDTGRRGKERGREGGRRGGRRGEEEVNALPNSHEGV